MASGSKIVYTTVWFLHEHAQGSSDTFCPSSFCLSSTKKISNILQADTSSTYNCVISFANSPILTFVYLIIRNTLQFSVLSGLSYYPVQLVIHLEIPCIEL